MRIVAPEITPFTTVPARVIVVGGGVMVTVSVAVPSFPAASLAVAVQTLIVSAVTVGAVNVLVATSNDPLFVHVTLGPLVTATLSVAETVEFPVIPDSTVNVAGSKLTCGAAVSAGGGGGGGTTGVVEPEDPPEEPPPQADKRTAQKTADTHNFSLKFIKSPILNKLSLI